MKTSLPVLQTGQRTCHDASGKAVSCVGSGQDAEFSRGLPWPECRFAGQGQMVEDRLTGLVWSRDANPAEYPMTWPEALDWVSEQNRHGVHDYQDWLP